MKFYLLSSALIACGLLAGCNGQSNTKNASKEANSTVIAQPKVYGAKELIDLPGVDESLYNTNCEGEIARSELFSLNNMGNSTDIEFGDFKTIKRNPTSSECEVRFMTLDRVNGISNQKIISYKISKEENGSYSYQQNRGVEPKVSNSVALDHSCGGSNAKILVEYFVLFDYNGIEDISIDSVITESKNNNSSTCSASVSIMNPDPYSSNAARILDVQYLHYKILLTDDKEHVMYQKL